MCIMKHYFLYDPIAGNGKCAEILSTLSESQYPNIVCIDLTEIEDIQLFINNVENDDKIIIPKKAGKTRVIRFFLPAFHCFLYGILQTDLPQWPDGSGPSDCCRNTDCA